MPRGCGMNAQKVCVNACGYRHFLCLDGGYGYT